jgi:hypothetical protein
VTQGPDGRFQIRLDQLNFQQTTATGVVTGTKYVINEADHITQVSANAQVLQSTVNGQLIGQGTATNTLFHLTFVETVNANGQVTASVENINFQCIWERPYSVVAAGLLESYISKDQVHMAISESSTLASKLV